ncbi:hypothetical protein BU26DRAFT_568020 [Trematosphaeria pertusa]|uniref:Uncharacterized protein n=1 Tax=Trematosphaeria pertusa TaxID=390896 RepID=A0A6A6I4J0_9PLEO|nr:uncharacterized protein BU26DRAFT_568020 [Trematosphaeria pertusa]KAF2245434.1 hypothetical protein BU26DRAFT_568020 [Trematosphaeria pertusa]
MRPHVSSYYISRSTDSKINDSQASTHSNSLHIGYIIAIVIGITALLCICLMPSPWMVNTYDWMRRGFKPKPKQEESARLWISRHTSPLWKPPKTAEERRREEEQRNREAEEKKNKAFLKGHLDTLRAWRKPQKPDVEEPVVIPMTGMAPLQLPPPAVQPTTRRYRRDYEGFKEWVRDQRG